MSPSVRSLYEAAGFRVGAFECRPGDPAWSSENSVGDGYYVVFPGTPVLIEQAGARPVITNQNHTIFYNPRQVYRRGLMSRDGDRCVFLQTDDSALAGCAEAWGVRLDAGSSLTFPFVDGPLARTAFQRQRLLARYLARASRPDDLWVQETILGVVGRAVHDALAVRGTRPRPRHRPTDARHDDLVEQAKLTLTTRFREPMGVDALARTVNASPFHLARVFRARTGYSLHGYRNELRLRAALDLLADTTDDLTSIALDLGYGSHSHFSQAFRQAFGATPSSFRLAAPSRTVWPRAGHRDASTRANDMDHSNPRPLNVRIGPP
jgi:AraC family transcriptional regulator